MGAHEYVIIHQTSHRQPTLPQQEIIIHVSNRVAGDEPFFSVRTCQHTVGARWFRDIPLHPKFILTAAFLRTFTYKNPSLNASKLQSSPLNFFHPSAGAGNLAFFNLRSTLFYIHVQPLNPTFSVFSLRPTRSLSSSSTLSPSSCVPPSPTFSPSPSSFPRSRLPSPPQSKSTRCLLSDPRSSF